MWVEWMRCRLDEQKKNNKPNNNNVVTDGNGQENMGKDTQKEQNRSTAWAKEPARACATTVEVMGTMRETAVHRKEKEKANGKKAGTTVVPKGRKEITKAKERVGISIAKARRATAKAMEKQAKDRAKDHHQSQDAGPVEGPISNQIVQANRRELDPLENGCQMHGATREMGEQIR
jgi:hypothetical protein